jgi:chromosome segregation ATPase|tara:strand:- start:189 stop:674 length:486 start_codon:yes stop_codon:yes gene_type:complete
MIKENILNATTAVENLEGNSVKLGEVVAQLTSLKNDLKELKAEVENAQKINKTSNDTLSKFSKAIDDVQDKLVQDFRVRLAEGNAEQISRIKDANEKIISLEAKLDRQNTKLTQTNKSNDKLLEIAEQNTAQLKVFQRNSYLLQILILAGVIYLSVQNLGF